MNVLILSPLDITELNHGAALRIHNIAQGLSQSGNNVTLIVCLHQMRRCGFSIEPLQRNLTVIRSSFRELLFSSFFISKIREADIIQLEFPSYSFIIPWLRLMGKNLVLDEHGVELEFIKEIHQATGRKLKLTKLLRTLLLEWIGVKCSSAIFVCSNIDGKKLQEIYSVPEKKIIVIPNGVAKEFFKPVKAINYGLPAILFLGSYNHPPNISAVKFLITEVIPRVFSKNNEAVFVFVGRNPPSWLGSGSYENRIRVFGNVDDVKPFIAGAKIVVTPIFHGSGTRIKILECGAIGKPIVSTSKGAEGLDVIDGKNILIRDDTQEFSAAVLKLLDDDSLAYKIGANLRQLVEEEYSWTKIVTKILKGYKLISS
jgi:glycosyltransferase involved in cell wall biosynthesis